MAPPRKTPTPEDLEILKTAYDGLQTASEELQAANLNIYRLMCVKLLYVSSDQANSYHGLLERHRRAAFGDQDPWGLGRDHLQWKERNRNVIDSAELLDQELDGANASKARLESVQSALQCCINRLSRPCMRDLTLLDLPDEVLLEIFEHVEYDHFPFGRFFRVPYYDCWTPCEDIKALRLVCKRFCSIGSQLLVRVVHLDFHQESLTRLDEISRHPTISKGVRAIKVVLHLYNSSFTEIEPFISFHAEEAERQIDMYDNVKMWEWSNVSKGVGLEMIARGKELVATLRRLLSGEPFEEEQQYRARVSEIHKRYQALLQRQDSLMQSDNFYQVVGSAIASMPCARSLIFDDSHLHLQRPNPRKLMVPGADMWERLCSCMLQPLNGYQAKTDHLQPPNYQCIIPLIDAVRHAGAFLRHLTIKLSSLGRPMDLVPAPDLRPIFSSGMQRLKTFSFKCGYPDDDGDNLDADDVHKFLFTFLDTSNLQSLSLDMRGEQEGHFPLRLRQIISRKQSLHKLDDIFLGQCALNYADLIAFLRRLPEPMVCFNLEQVCLLTGSWRAALDALREKQPRTARLKEAHGAECEDMTEEAYNRVFKDDRFGYNTGAEAYISGRPLRNPIQELKELEDGTLDVTE